jgi:hypothetical protein
MRINRYDLGKVFIVFILLIIQNLSTIMQKRDYMEFSFLETYYMKLFGGGFSRTQETVFVILSGFLFIVIFQFLFSNFIYKDLHISSIYRFSRNKNRRVWFAEKCLSLAFYDFLYTIFYVAGIYILSVKVSGETASNEEIVFILSTYIVIFMYIYLTTLFINILSISCGSNFSFAITFVLQIILAQLAINHERIPVIGKSELILQLNPVANMIVSWKVSSLVNSILYFTIYIAVCIFLSFTYISRIDLGLSNKEI